MQVSPSFSPSLPPTWRDFQVYRLVKIEQKSTRTAARELRLSQTRVCQIVARVAEYLLASTPAADDDEQRQRQLRLAEQLAAERIDYLLQLAMTAFENTHLTVEIRNQRMVSGGNGSDVRFLHLAARLALMAAKLPAPYLTDVAFPAEPCDEVEPEEEAVDDDEGEEDDSESPPAGDCSPRSLWAYGKRSSRAETVDAKPLPEESAVSGVSADLLRKLEQAGPVQPAAETPPAPLPGSPQERRKAFWRG